MFITATLLVWQLAVAHGTQALCPDGSVLCGESLCIPQAVLPSLASTFRLCGDSCTYASDACQGSCPKGFMNCHGKCYLEESYWRCGDQCIPRSDKCKGSCPYTFYDCGAKCRQTDNNPYWKMCGEKCIFRDEPCEGMCPPDLFKCGGKCETKDLLEHFAWRGCGSECIPPIKACNGTCPSGYQVQQDRHCIKMEHTP
eukprot:TRINITY_DN5975_c0_g1_i1.p1 TRINITY_DN5975_c0_g1~~TRINITY_DN5975_c0_g1_i1.p1  ORF type:complete len:198 (-),score=36.30 TRINITY_DN5975_c0_g1_i1:184-777(-)